MIAHLGVVGECHQHHVHQGNHGEDAQHQEGGHHEHLVDVLVQQALQVIDEGGDLLAGLLLAQSDVAAADIGAPDDQDSHNDDHGGNSVQQDLLRVVALYVFVNAEILVPDLSSFGVAQAGQHAQPMCAAIGDGHVGNECSLDSQENNALDPLACGNIAQTHDQAGSPHQGAAVFQCADQRGRITFPASSRGFGQFFR